MTDTYRLILLRHGESEWNALDLFTGWVDVGLSPKGEAEAVHAGQLLRDVLHRAHVGGDVLAGDAVATGRGAHQPAVLVEQGDGEPVDLQLA